MRRVYFVGLVFVMACASDSLERTCTDDSQCLQDGIGGTCQTSPRSSSKYCTFLSGNCPSGHSWGILAGDNLGETCVAASPMDAGTDALETSITASPPTTSGRSVTFRFAATKSATFECKLEPLETDFTACTSPKTYDALLQAKNPYTFSVRATAMSQVDETPAIYTWNVDSNGPTFTSINLPDEDGVSEPAFDVTYTLSEGTITSCSLDGRALSSCTSPIKISGLHVGQHGIELDTTDAFGNKGILLRNWVVPPVSIFQAASLVFGQQNDFTTNDINRGGVDGGLSGPYGISSNGTQLAVGDQGNCRVPYWVSAPVTIAGAFNYIVGQTQPDARSCRGFPLQPADSKTFGVNGVATCLSDIDLWVSDPTQNRVLLFSLPVTIYAPSAQLVLGPSTFEGNMGGADVDHMSTPEGLWCDNNRIMVADSSNSRILIWNSRPTTNGQRPDLELGWPDFNASSPTTASASTFKIPSGVHFGGGKLFVADTQNNRVLVWNSLPTSNGQPADFVLGQRDMSSTAPGLGPASLDHPLSAYVYGDSLFVADRANRRVLVWVPLPTASGEPAHSVLGATSLDALPPEAGDQHALFGPRDVTVANGHLFVSDGNRILMFQLRD